MRRAATALVLVGCAAGIAALLAIASNQRIDAAFSIENLPVAVAIAQLQPESEVCQLVIDAPVRFGIVQFTAGTYGLPGPGLTVSAREVPSGRTLAEGTVAAGYPDGSAPLVQLDRPVDPAPIALCVRNDGPGRVAIYGGYRSVTGTSVAQIDGQSVDFDVVFRFWRSTPTTALGEVPAFFERAALFRPGFVGAWTFWLLAVLVLVGVPLLLAGALRSASGSAPGARAAEEVEEHRL